MSDESYGFIIGVDGVMRDMPTPAFPDSSGGQFSLKQLQDAVGGGLIQMIRRVKPQHRDWSYHGHLFLANEEGMLKEMDYNEVATSMVGIHLVGPVAVIPKGSMN